LSAIRWQKGFTLIELMVVVVILAVVLSAATLALTPSESARLNQQSLQLKGALQQTCDQAVFQQKIHALLVDKKGMTMRMLSRNQWQPVDAIKDVPWVDGVMATWESQPEFQTRFGLPGDGWLCWPTGEILPGLVKMRMDQLAKQLSWTPLMKFTTQQGRVNDTQ